MLSILDGASRPKPRVKLRKEKDFLKLHGVLMKGLGVVGQVSAPTVSRDLAEGVRRGVLTSHGDKRTARYRFR
jgi:Fic family protein